MQAIMCESVINFCRNTTYPTQLLYCIHVHLIFLHLLTIPDDLFYLTGIDVFRPSSFNMIDTSTVCFKSFCIHLKEKKKKVDRFNIG